MTKATIVLNGKPVKSYPLNIETEDLEKVRKETKRNYSEEVLVDLQYTQINN